jgi:electron transfer flavoprotein alpha subunit
MATFKHILVYCETVDGELSSIAKESLGIGLELAAQLGEELCAALIGGDVDRLAAETIALGARKVYVVQEGLFKDYRIDSYASAMFKIVQDLGPRIVLLGQTLTGLDLAPRLATRLNSAAVLDCVNLSIDTDSNLLLMTKPVYGGKALATFLCEAYPQVATIRAKSMVPPEKDLTRQGEIVTLDVGMDESQIRTRVLEKITERTEGIKLEDAEIVIAGGRGIGSAEGFKELEALAKLLKAAVVGASRPPCDEGWVPTTIQVGLSGKIIAPNLYVAVGISGSSQHIAGCSGSGTIVAINRDPNANIFREARFGVVGDWKTVLPAFSKAIADMAKD